MTILMHMLIFILLLFTLYFCFKGDIVLFTWHPLFMSLGWLLFMTEAILALNKNSILTKYLSHHERVRCHWIIQIIGVSFTTASFTIIFIQKINIDKKHFTSWHGLIGLMAIILSILTCMGGIFALYRCALKRYIKPNMIKLIHCVGGTLTFSTGGLTVLLSLSSQWFEQKINKEVFPKVTTAIVLITVFCWTLEKPIKTCYNTFKRL